MRAVMALTDRVVVFNHGELLAEGRAADVMQRPEVMTAYLGHAPMLEVRDLQVAYGAAPALWGVSLDVGAGELLCVVGPNGAGKTTLINALAGMLPRARRPHRLRRRATSRAGRRIASAKPASRSCPKGGACSPA